MRKVILKAIAFSLITGCLLAQEGWQLLNSGTTSSLHGVYFIDVNTGYVCGANSTILKTTNGGINWSPQISGVTGAFTEIVFAGASTGFACGDMGIIRTTNGGMNWTSVYTGAYCNDITFSDSVVYAVTMNSTLKSTNYGTTWVNIMSPGVEVYGIHFINSMTGMVSGNNGLLRRTLDGGQNWSQGGAWFPGTYTFRSSYLNNPGQGFVTCSYNSGWPNYFQSYSIYRAGFGSGSYSMVYSNPSLGLNSIYFCSTDTGYAAGGNYTGTSLVLKSTDAGTSWVQMNITATQSLLIEIFFINASTGYITGWNGTIIKTTTGGITGIKNINENIPESFSLSQNYPNPFNPTTNIEFSIPKAGFVNITVYDALGSSVEVLQNGDLKPGTYKADWNASNFPSGIYFYKLSAGDFVQTKKMILIK